MADRRRIIINPDEPTTGDFAYQFYDRAHPHFGDKETINRLRSQLRGLRGKRVTIRLHAGRMAEGDDERALTMQRTITLNKYSDIFGSGGAYGEMIHEIRERHSEDALYAYTVDIVAAA